jgi:hypothetical protein
MVNESMKNYNTSFTYSKVLTMDFYHWLWTKTWLRKINFLSDNINSLRFKVHVTAYLLFMYHTEANQTLNLTGFIMCLLAAHPPVNKWHITHKFPVFYSDCFSPSSELHNSLSRWTHCTTGLHFKDRQIYHYFLFCCQLCKKPDQ